MDRSTSKGRSRSRKRQLEVRSSVGDRTESTPRREPKKERDSGADGQQRPALGLREVLVKILTKKMITIGGLGQVPPSRGMRKPARRV